MDTILPVLLFVVIAAAVSVGLIILPRLVAPRRSGAVKEMPYESGMDPIHDTKASVRRAVPPCRRNISCI